MLNTLSAYFPNNNSLLNGSLVDDALIPGFLFKKKEKRTKTFIFQTKQFYEFQWPFIILWQTRQIKSLFNLNRVHGGMVSLC